MLTDGDASDLGQGSLRFLDADIQHDIWSGFHGAASEEAAPKARGGAAGSFVRSWLGDRATQLGHQFARWATAMERFICVDLDIAPGEWQRYQGRGCLPRMKVQPWGVRKPAIQCKTTNDAHWWQAVAKYIRLFATCRDRGHGERQQVVAKEALGLRARHPADLSHMDPIHAELWERRLTDITAVPVPVAWGMYRNRGHR